MNEAKQNDKTNSAAKRILQDPNAELALSTIAKLSSAGYIAYLAGGCVRDALLGKTPKDYDVATNALPEQIRDLFGYPRTLAIGAAFGVITVLGRKNSQCQPVEVATFRSDGTYSDGRHPDSVEFSSPEQDALRRDFTINGMFFDPNHSRVIDFVGGMSDLAAKQIRAIRDPDDRFHEDKLRLLRAIRFAATYGFKLEEQTLQAVQRRAAEVTTCSGERIGAEMLRILDKPTAAAGIQLLHSTGMAKAIMPAIAGMWQNSKVLDRACRLLDFNRTSDQNDKFSVNLALLILSDRVDSVSHALAIERLMQVTAAWHLSNEQRDAIRLAAEDLDSLLKADQLAWSELQPLLIKRYRDTSVQVARVFAEENEDYQPAIARFEKALSLPADELDPRPLLTGNDLIEMGLKPGPNFKQILQRVRDAQLDCEIETEAEARKLAEEMKG